MTEQSMEYLSALLYARADISNVLTKELHLGSERKVRIFTFLPAFNVSKAQELINSLKPQVVMVDAHVQGFSLPEIISLQRSSENPFLLVGLADAGSSEMEEMIGVNLNATFSLPFGPNIFDRIEEELPKIYEEVKRGWGKGAWGAAAPDVIKAAAAAAGGTSWQRQAIAVWTPKGGVGKTVVACELAAMLAAIGGRDVALIDANMNGGHVKLRLNVDFPYGILNAASTYHQNKGHASLEADSLKKVQGYLYPIPGTPNLKVLPGVSSMDQSTNEYLVGEAGREFMKWLIATLKRQFDFIVIDLGSSINVGVHVGALENADFIVALCEPDLTSVVDVKEAVHESLVKGHGIGIERFSLVINKWQDGLKLSLKETASFAGITAMGIIPNDPTGNITLAGNDGHSYVARYANEKKNPPSTDKTLDGFAEVAGQFYPPIATAWSERLKQRGRKRGRR